MNEVHEGQTDGNVCLTKEERQTSAPCSDFINNSRSMSASADEHATYGDATLGKKDVETWLHNDVEADCASPEQIATGQQEHQSDGTESPKRSAKMGTAFADVVTGTPAHEADRADEFDIPHISHEMTDIYERQLMEEAKKLQEASQKEYRFSMKDIFDNPALEDAAKQELRERPPITPTLSNADSVISYAESRVSHMEQTVCNSENLDRDADRDLQSGQVEISTLLDRLNIGKASCLDLLKFVQKLHQAEEAYSRSLLSVSRMTMSNIGHTDGFRYASECLCELPMSTRSAHSKISQNLAECESSLTNVVCKIKKLSEALVAEAPKLTEVVRSKRSALSRSKSRHQVAYKRMECIEEKGIAPSRPVDDPWLTEGQLAHDYTQLISGQVSVKKALASAYDKVTEVELLRLQTSKNVISSLVQSYGSAIDECVVPFVTDINKALLVVDAEEEVVDLKKSKRNSQISEQTLRAQCVDQETTRCGELFASPDIVRQGILQVLDEESRSWVNARFVLTKAGLYWFTNENTGPRPDDYLTLSRTTIEQAKSPGLKLVQEGSTYFSWKRAVILRAPSTEEYCEWAIALREAIQDVNGRAK